MTNGEKYKTAKERAEALNKFCHEQKSCLVCPAFREKDVERGCNFRWLDLEAEEEKPLPCPFCGGFLIQFDLSGFSFVCDCGYHTKIFKTKHEAIAAHNRVAKKCMEVNHGS